MKYNININQKGVIDAGLNVDLVDMAIYDFLKAYTHAQVCRRMVEAEVVYYSVPYKKVIDENPLLPIKSTDGIYRRFKKLEAAQIIKMHPDNAKLSMVWFCFGEISRHIDFYTPGLESDPPDEKPTPPGRKTGGPSDKYPTHYSIVLLYNNYTSAELISETWERWKKYKKQQHRFKYKSEDSELTAFKKLSEYSKNNSEAAAKIVEQSISNGWAGLFELKEKETNKHSAPADSMYETFTMDNKAF